MVIVCVAVFLALVFFFDFRAVLMEKKAKITWIYAVCFALCAAVLAGKALELPLPDPSDWIVDAVCALRFIRALA